MLYSDAIKWSSRLENFIVHWSGFFDHMLQQEKLKKINKRCLRIILNDFISEHDTFLGKSNKSIMEIKRLRILATEIFKTFSNINHNYMKSIFTPRTNVKVRANDIFAKSHNSVNYGDKDLTALDPKKWNKLTQKIKSESNVNKFKAGIKSGFGLKGKCNVCIMT